MAYPGESGEKSKGCEGKQKKQDVDILVREITCSKAGRNGDTTVSSETMPVPSGRKGIHERRSKLRLGKINRNQIMKQSFLCYFKYFDLVYEDSEPLKILQSNDLIRFIFQILWQRCEKQADQGASGGGGIIQESVTEG